MGRPYWRAQLGRRPQKPTRRNMVCEYGPRDRRDFYPKYHRVSSSRQQDPFIMPARLLVVALMSVGAAALSLTGVPVQHTAPRHAVPIMKGKGSRGSKLGPRLPAPLSFFAVLNGAARACACSAGKGQQGARTGWDRREAAHAEAGL
eukprot:5120301-Prymnesium_polylepis.2